MKTHQLFWTALIVLLPLTAFAQRTFTTPGQAAEAFASAVRTQNEAALTEMLGENWRQVLPPEGVDPQAVARFNRDWAIGHTVESENGTAHISVGKNGWRLPIPVIKTEAGWQFDMHGAADEILTRTLGRNELSAIEAMHAYVAAQQDYYMLNHAYAQKLISSAGKKDGLYWPVSPGETPSPLGPDFSPGQPGLGYHGYHFRILSTPGGTTALIAWPVVYGQTGITTFMVDKADRVWQTDFGRQTTEKVRAIKRFAPDDKWLAVQ